MVYNGTKMKKRNDRNYVLYRIEAPECGDSYIGLTVADGRAFLRSVKVRVQKHQSRARREDKDWTLCRFLRDNDVTLTYEVLEVVRGRKPAYQRERELISELSPTLNTF
jgi:hypothetical protein